MICSICGKEIKGFGNNASPFKRSECCDRCNNLIILPLRLFLSKKQSAMKKLLVITPANGLIYLEAVEKDIPLKKLQKLVGGYIELYPIKNEYYHFIVDEEGYIKGKPLNILALELFGIRVVGNLVLCQKENFS